MDERKEEKEFIFWMCLMKKIVFRWKKRNYQLHHNFGDEEGIFPPNSTDGCVIILHNYRARRERVTDVEAMF